MFRKSQKRKRSESENFEKMLSESEAKPHGIKAKKFMLSESESKATLFKNQKRKRSER